MQRFCTVKGGHRPVVVGLAGAALLAAFAASAGPKDEACDRSYQRGLKAAGQGDWGAANKLFEQVAHDCPGFGVFLALAKSEMQLKPPHLLSARRHFTEALAAAREPGERSLASDGLAGVEARLGRLRLEGARAGVSVRIDGRPESPEGGVFFVEPGARQLTIETSDCPPQREVVDAMAGAEQQLRVQPCDKAPPPDAGPPDTSPSALPDAGAPPQATPDAGSPGPSPGSSGADSSPVPSSVGPSLRGRAGPSLVGPLVVGVGGLVVGAVGGVLWQQASGRYDTTIKACPGNQCPSEEALREVNATRRDMLLGQVVLGAGAAALVGAGVWWLLLPPGKPASSARVAPSLGPAGWGLSLRMTL